MFIVPVVFVISNRNVPICNRSNEIGGGKLGKLFLNSFYEIYLLQIVMFKVAEPLCDTPLIYYASIMGGTMILASMMHYINEIIIKKKWIK